MSTPPEEIAKKWRKQMQRGYLKLAILFVLTRSPQHGYELIKRISAWTLNMIVPTAGGLYPALRELENEDLVKGTWSLKPEERKKVYQITNKGRSVLHNAVEKHLKLVASVRRLFLKELVDLKITDETDLPFIAEPLMKALIPDADSKIEERIEILKQLKKHLEEMSSAIPEIIENIEMIQKDLKLCAS